MPLTERFDDAFRYASRLHQAQVRKGSTIPYVSHLMAVAALVIEHDGSEDQVIAALLHDAVEDQGGKPTAVEIRSRFGDAVADIVEACTDSDVTPKPPWRERKQAYVDHLRTADPKALLVSAADKLHNARSILAGVRAMGVEHFERFKGKKDGTLWYYCTVVARLRERGHHTNLVSELARTVAAIEELAGKSP